MRDGFLDGDGVRLHVVRAGEGPPVVLLHGFPEFWYSWRHQIEALAGSGFSVLAPDLRGFNLSDKPAGVNAYRIAALVADVVRLIAATGAPRAHLVGHDWGGMIAWCVAGHHPELIDRLVILNAPHPAIFHRALRRSRQALRSAYVPLFALPRVPELLLSAFGHFGIRQMLVRAAANSGAFPRDEQQRYVDAIAVPGALTAGLNYYRANIRVGLGGMAIGRIAPPTLVIWGEEDPALGVNLLDGLGAFVPHLRVERLPRVGHWVQQEAPTRVNELLVDFLAPAGLRRPPAGAT